MSSWADQAPQRLMLRMIAAEDGTDRKYRLKYVANMVAVSLVTCAMGITGSYFAVQGYNAGTYLIESLVGGTISVGLTIASLGGIGEIVNFLRQYNDEMITLERGDDFYSVDGKVATSRVVGGEFGNGRIFPISSLDDIDDKWSIGLDKTRYLLIDDLIVEDVKADQHSYTEDEVYNDCLMQRSCVDYSGEFTLRRGDETRRFSYFHHGHAATGLEDLLGRRETRIAAILGKPPYLYGDEECHVPFKVERIFYPHP